MGTKRTKCPIDTPDKAKGIESKRTRGRPRKILASDPERHFLAILQASIDVGAQRGLSERNIVDTFASMRYGRPIPTRENYEKLARGETIQVALIAGSPRRGQAEKDRYWHSQNAFRPLADAFRCRLRRIRKKSPSDPDRRWLAYMSTAWKICFQGDLQRERYAADCAKTVGEENHFEEVMRPLLHEAAEHPLEFFEFWGILLPTSEF